MVPNTFSYRPYPEYPPVLWETEYEAPHVPPPRLAVAGANPRDDARRDLEFTAVLSEN